jgi:hypothetical protein
VSAPPLTALSTRQLLARTALSAALMADGVVSGTAGRLGTHVTRAGAELLPGVSVSAQAEDRYRVSLFLVCRPVALHPLAERVRAQVLAAAELAGLADRLGSVSVRIEDVLEPAGRVP